MPPARGRGKAAGKSSNSSPKLSGSKMSIEVRESLPSSSLKGFESARLTNIEDRISIYDEIVPLKFRGKQLNLETNRKLISFTPSSENSNDGILTYQEGSVTKQAHVYKKTVALMDPYYCMRNNERASEPFFWDFQVDTIKNPENQGYIDIVGSSLVARLSSLYKTPHFCDFYGAFRGRADVFHYNLEDDIDDFRFTHWFWKAIDAGEFGLRVVEKESGNKLSMAEIQSLLRPDEEYLSDDETDSSEESDESDESDESETGSESDTSSSISAETLGSSTEQSSGSSSFDCGLEEASIASAEECIEINRRSKTASTFSTASDSTNLSFSDDYTIHAELRGMPVAIMFLEKQSGTLDEFLETTAYAPIKTPEQEGRWAAWLFQICAALTQVQVGLNLTHNDLHTNNVLWKKTDKEFLYYKDTKGRQWRVPTHGYIFTIIDYGRAIFTLSGFTCISSDYNDGHDAAGMYNFGPISDDDYPRVHPNRSFDLCRLSCSLIRALFPTNPANIPTGAVITKDGSAVIRETVHPVFNVLWTWLKTKTGQNVLETADGHEKYPGFELYSVIAADVKDAVPDAQLGKAVFQPFLLKSSLQLPAGSSWITIPA
jgi:hypothetical protein